MLLLFGGGTWERQPCGCSPEIREEGGWQACWNGHSLLVCGEMTGRAPADLSDQWWSRILSAAHRGPPGGAVDSWSQRRPWLWAKPTLEWFIAGKTILVGEICGRWCPVGETSRCHRGQLVGKFSLRRNKWQKQHRTDMDWPKPSFPALLCHCGRR